jgi:hypothetical protein
MVYAVTAESAVVSSVDHDYNTTPVQGEERLQDYQVHIQRCDNVIAKLHAKRFGLYWFAGDDKLRSTLVFSHIVS